MSTSRMRESTGRDRELPGSAHVRCAVQKPQIVAGFDRDVLEREGTARPLHLYSKAKVPALDSEIRWCVLPLTI